MIDLSFSFSAGDIRAAAATNNAHATKKYVLRTNSAEIEIKRLMPIAGKQITQSDFDTGGPYSLCKAT